MNQLQAWISKLAPVVEVLGAIVAAFSAVQAQVSGGKPLDGLTVIAAVIAALGHSVNHTTTG